MPGVDQISLDYLNDEIQELVDLGIKSAMVFGVPAEKDAVGSQAYHDHGIVQKVFVKLKKIFRILLLSQIHACVNTQIMATVV